MKALFPDIFPLVTIDGALYIADDLGGGEPQKLWTEEACNNKVIEHLESLPKDPATAREVSKKWWQKIMQWVDNEASKDFYLGFKASQNVIRLERSWDELTGETLN